MKRTLFFLFFYIGSSAGFAQTPFFQKYSLSDKNEKIKINILFQDKIGYIWMGTNKGLYRFDGFTFSHYSLDSLPDNQVTAIAQDSLGRIWMGHSTGALSYFEGNKIKMFVTEEGPATKEVSDILFDRKGVLWFSTLNDGLYYVTNGRLYRLDEEDGMPDIYIYDLEESPAGEIWAGTDRGIAICNLRNNRPEIRVINQKLGLPDNIVRKVKFQNADKVWFGTQDSGVILYTPSSKEMKPVLMHWNSGTVSDMIIKQDQIWVSYSQKEILMIDMESQLKTQNFAIGGFANVLLLDHENNIWAGGNAELVRTPGTEISFFEALDPGIKQNIIAIAEDKDERIWFSNGTDLFTLKKNQRPEKVNNPVFQNPPVISLHCDSVGNIWVGTFGGGAYQLNTKGKIIHHFKNELRNGNILSITSSGNEVWLATLEGATRILMKNGKYRIDNMGSKEGLSSDYIYQAFKDSKGRVWIGTDGQDVDMFDQAGIHHFSTGKNKKTVFGFTEGGDNSIWANVQGEGLYKFAEDKFIPVNKLNSHNVHGLITNSAGNVVTIQDEGIEIYDPVRNEFRFLGEEVGIKDKKGNLNSIYRNQRGEILIGTDNGMIQYQTPAASKVNKPVPFVLKLKTSSKTFDVFKQIDLAYDENDIVIGYIGFWYHNPSVLMYQYKLENFDRGWISSKDHEATYSRLPPGEYTFHLRVSESEDYQYANETTIQFKISAPFWQQGWFYIFGAMVTVYAGYLYLRLRERNLLLERQTLKLKVEERTTELQMRNEEIHAQAEELQSQAIEIKKINDHLEELVKERTFQLEKKNQALEEYAFITAHKLRSPLARILGLVNLMKITPHTPESKECMDHLDIASKDLDEVVGSITRVIEKADS